MARGDSKTKVKKRKASFYNLAKSLGLPPSVTTQGFEDFIKTATPVAITDDEIVKKLAAASPEAQDVAAQIPKFMLHAATIKPDVQNAVATIAGECVEFAESSQTVSDFAKEIKAAATSVSSITENVVIVGRSAVKEDLHSTMSTTFFDAFNISWMGKKGKDTNVKLHSLRERAMVQAKPHVVRDLIASEKRDVSDPAAGTGRATSADNCTVHTIFMVGQSGLEDKGGEDASLFLNFIPSAYLSQCVPYFDIQIVPNPMFGNTASILQSLVPHLALGPSIGSKKAGAKIDGDMSSTISEDGQEPHPSRVIGVDTFLTPQTLTRSQARHALEANHIDPVPSDPFKPIASVMGFEVTTSMHTKEVSKAKGSLSLKFPDRTKIEGLAQLALGGSHATNIVVWFGWAASPTHDASSMADPMMEYINNQRVKMTFKPTISTMTFTEDGGCDVTLDLHEMEIDDQDALMTGTAVRLDELSTHLRMTDANDPKYMGFVMSELSLLDPYDNLALKKASQILVKLIDVKKKKKKNQTKKKTKKSKALPDKMYEIKALKTLEKGGLYKDTSKLIEDFANSTGRAQPEVFLYFKYSVNDDWKNDVLIAAEEKIQAHPKFPKKQDVVDQYSRSAGIPAEIHLTSPKAADLAPDVLSLSHSQFKDYVLKILVVYRGTKYGVGRKKAKNDPIYKGLVRMWVAFKELENPRTLTAYHYQKLDTFGLPSKEDPEAKGEKIPNDAGAGLVDVTGTKGGPPESGATQMTTEQKVSLYKAPSLPRVSASAILLQRLKILKSIRSFPLSNGGVWRLRKDNTRAICDTTGADVDPGNDNFLKWWLSKSATKHYIPLSSIVHVTLGQALFASHLYDEVQIVFYDYNESSGENAKGSNIGNTPIAYNTLRTAYNGSRGSSMALVNKLLRKINDPNSEVLMGYIKDRRSRTTEGPDFPTVKPSNVRTVVNYFLDEDSNKKTRRVVRVSFYDAKGDMDGGSMRQVLKSASRDGKIPVPEDSAAVAISKLKKMRKKAFYKALGASGVLDKNKEGKDVIKSSPEVWRAIKSCFKAVHPFVNYGTTAGAIKNANLTMAADGLERLANYLESHQSFRKTNSGKQFAAGGGNKQRKLFVGEKSPMNLNIELQSIGCPMIAPGSQYFFDFYTNTDADNFYAVQTVKHNISPGNFDTTITILRQDGPGTLITSNDVSKVKELYNAAQKKDEESS